MPHLEVSSVQLVGPDLKKKWSKRITCNHSNLSAAIICFLILLFHKPNHYSHLFYSLKYSQLPQKKFIQAQIVILKELEIQTEAGTEAFFILLIEFLYIWFFFNKATWHIGRRWCSIGCQNASPLMRCLSAVSDKSCYDESQRNSNPTAQHLAHTIHQIFYCLTHVLWE